MAKTSNKAILVIAGPGAGKTHNMVESIIKKLHNLHPCRFMAVVTYTNSATNNIKNRLSKRINIPDNLFIGTIHAFLNKFILIPFSSFSELNIGQDKMFMQFGLDEIFSRLELQKEKSKRAKTPQEKAVLRNRIKNRLNERGYITFDQTLAISRHAMDNQHIARVVSNRLQYLFVDEFQDSGTEVFNILENLRKRGKTQIYCVGDPEQYIQSFDSSVRAFTNIPILKAAWGTGYEIRINDLNFRSTAKIVTFLNNFNGRKFGTDIFKQSTAPKSDDTCQSVPIGEDILFIQKWDTVTPILKDFNQICERLSIPVAERCVLAKNNDVTGRIIAAVNNQFSSPKKDSYSAPLKVIQDTFLFTLGMNQTQFCEQMKVNRHDLRKICIKLFHAIRNDEITDENSYGIYVSEQLRFELKVQLPTKIQNLKFDNTGFIQSDVITVANIHTIKGLEALGVLAIAKNEQELLMWIETDRVKRDSDQSDFCRLGYVAFSRAQKLLCIACLTAISSTTRSRLTSLGVVPVPVK